MKKRLGIGVLVLAAGVLAGPVALRAHHGAALYDESKAVVVKGVVTDWVWETRTACSNST